MQVRWPKFLVPLVGLFTNTANSRRQIDLPAAADFLFEQQPHGSVCADRTPGQPQQPGIQLGVKGQAPYLRTRSESLTFSHTDVPSLTIAANSPGVVEICGNDREDWSLRLCAFGEGSTETEAHDRLKRSFAHSRWQHGIREWPWHRSHGRSTGRPDCRSPCRRTNNRSQLICGGSSPQHDRASPSDGYTRTGDDPEYHWQSGRHRFRGRFRRIRGHCDPQRRSRDQFEVYDHQVPGIPDGVGTTLCPRSRSAGIPNPVSSPC